MHRAWPSRSNSRRVGGSERHYWDGDHIGPRTKRGAASRHHCVRHAGALLGISLDDVLSGMFGSKDLGTDLNSVPRSPQFGLISSRPQNSRLMGLRLLFRLLMNKV